MVNSPIVVHTYNRSLSIPQINLDRSTQVTAGNSVLCVDAVCVQVCVCARVVSVYLRCVCVHVHACGCVCAWVGACGCICLWVSSVHGWVRVGVCGHACGVRVSVWVRACLCICRSRASPRGSGVCVLFHESIRRLKTIPWEWNWRHGPQWSPANNL